MNNLINSNIFQQILDILNSINYFVYLYVIGTLIINLAKVV